MAPNLNAGGEDEDDYDEDGVENVLEEYEDVDRLLTEEGPSEAEKLDSGGDLLVEASEFHEDAVVAPCEDAERQFLLMETFLRRQEVLYLSPLTQLRLSDSDDDLSSCSVHLS